MSATATLDELSALPARMAALETALARWLPDVQVQWRPELTPREHEVLALAAAGWTNQEIADELCIAERTARTHVSDIICRLNAPNRTTVALWALAAQQVSMRRALALMARRRPHLLIGCDEE